MIYKKCFFCFKKYFSKAYNSKYCSRICANKNYEQTNKEKIANRKKKYYVLKKEIFKDNEKKYRKKNAKEIKEKKKEYYLKNKEQINKKRKLYVFINKNKIRKYHRNWKKNKRLTDINFKILDSLRSRLNEVLTKNKKTDTTINLIGCNLGYLKKYLESKFESWMTWDNYGYYGWHIDHIKPCASFDLRCPVQQLACFHYSNLQPLEAFKNMSKGAKII